jgi:hypothetical protein
MNTKFNYSTRARYRRRALLADGGRILGDCIYLHQCVLNGDFGTVFTFAPSGSRFKWVGVGRGRYQDLAVKRALGIPSASDLKGGRVA